MKKFLIYTYSSPTIELFKQTIQEILDLFETGLKTNDIFEYNVFCAIQTYANFDWAEFNTGDMEIPENISADTSVYSERMEYVEYIIDKILSKEIEKPEWMIFIEQELFCPGENSPSTFLYVKAKDEKYKKLGELIVNLLYSPSHCAAVI